MPSSPSASPVIHNLTYVLDENPIKTEPYGGLEFGGYPSLKQRNNSFDVKESMTVHCGYVFHFLYFLRMIYRPSLMWCLHYTNVSNQ